MDRSKQIIKPITNNSCFLRNEITDIIEKSKSKFSSDNWYMNKQKAQFIDPEKMVEGTFRSNTHSILRISKELYRYIGSHHPDNNNFLCFEEYIPLNKKEKENLAKIFLSHEESRVDNYYGSPTNTIVCSPIKFKLTKTKHHQYGRSVPLDKFNDIVNTLEENKNFIATKFKANRLENTRRIRWYTVFESKKGKVHEYTTSEVADSYWRKLIR